MGGNALKNCTTRRYSKQEYWKLVVDVLQKLGKLFPTSKQDNIIAYKNKSDFGDLDVLIESDTLPSNWVEKLIETFNPKEWVRNGNVVSFEYEEFQIDLISTPRNEYYTSMKYFAYNDLGNLLGRISNSLGFKLGHDGLSYTWKDGTYHFKTVVICTEWRVICDFLGVSYGLYCKGFETLEDIFKFVVDSPFFCKDIYLLENRNNYARTRDRKRPTYNAFLKWIESYEPTLDQTGNGDKEAWLPYAFKTIPGFQETFNRVQAEWDEAVLFKQKFNGGLVGEWTGLSGKDLGEFMKWLKKPENQFPEQRWLLDNELETIKAFIRLSLHEYMETTHYN